MKVKFNNATDWSIDFIEFSQLNANDVMWHKLIVELTSPLAINQSLWVAFKKEEQSEEILREVFAKENSSAECEILFPKEIIRSATDVDSGSVGWSIQLLIRTCSASNPSAYIQKGSSVEEFFVSNGLPLGGDGLPLTDLTVLELWEGIKGSEERIVTIYRTIQSVLDSIRNKVDKTTERQVLYGTDENGEQTAICWSEACEAESVPYRDSTGGIQTGNPTKEAHAIPKWYFENEIKGFDGLSVKLELDPQTFVLTAKLVDSEGNQWRETKNSAIDLPIESMIVNGEYDESSKTLVLTLQSGITISVPMSDLIEGLATAEDFEELSERFKNSTLNLNLENGEGANSVKTKGYGAQVTGEGSAYIGGVRYDDYADDPENATPAIMGGKQSFGAGGGVQVYGDWNAGFNKETKVYQRGGAAFGGGTQSGMTEAQFNKWYWSKFTDTACLIPDATGEALNDGKGLKDGKVTDFDGRNYQKAYSFGFVAGETGKAYGRSAFVGGGVGNIVYGRWSGILAGENNKTLSRNSAIAGGQYNLVDGRNAANLGGDSNNNHGLNSVILGGMRNLIEWRGNGSIIMGGQDNKVNAPFSGTGGQGNEVNTTNTHAFGYKLLTPVFKTAYDQLLGGHWNKPNEKALFQIGNGTSDTDRKNAFEVLTDGRAKLYGAPTEETDVVRLKELNAKIEPLNDQVDEIKTELYKNDFTTETSYTERTTANDRNFADGSKAILKKVVGSTVRSKNLIDLTTVDTPTLDKDVYRRIEFKLPIGNYTIAFDKDVYLQAAGSGVNIAVSITQPLFGFEITDTENEWIQVRMKGNSGTLWDYTNKFWVYEGTYSSDTMPKYQEYFKGLKSSSFGGIKSTNADGTKSDELVFPETSTPLGTTIDFENKKITNYGVDVVFTGKETVSYYPYLGAGVSIPAMLTEENYAIGISNEFPVKQSFSAPNTIVAGNHSNRFYFLDVLKTLGFTDNWVDASTPTTEEQAQAVADFKAYLAQRYADGNPVTIRYVSSTLQSESDFTDAQLANGNIYTAWKGGRETVIGNNGAEYGAENTLTQNYSLSSINSRLDTVEAVAKGAQQAISYDNYDKMITAFNVLSKDKYNVGQNIMIVTLNVPDLWVSEVLDSAVEFAFTSDDNFVELLKINGYVQVGHYKVSPLETGKVNLANYPTRAELNEIVNSLLNQIFTLETNLEQANNRISALENVDTGSGEVETLSITEFGYYPNPDLIDSKVDIFYDTLEKNSYDDVTYGTRIVYKTLPLTMYTSDLQKQFVIDEGESLIICPYSDEYSGYLLSYGQYFEFVLDLTRTNGSLVRTPTLCVGEDLDSTTTLTALWAFEPIRVRVQRGTNGNITLPDGTSVYVGEDQYVVCRTDNDNDTMYTILDYPPVLRIEG